MGTLVGGVLGAVAAIVVVMTTHPGPEMSFLLGFGLTFVGGCIGTMVFDD